MKRMRTHCGTLEGENETAPCVVAVLIDLHLAACRRIRIVTANRNHRRMHSETDRTSWFIVWSDCSRKPKKQEFSRFVGTAPMKYCRVSAADRCARIEESGTVRHSTLLKCLPGRIPRQGAAVQFAVDFVLECPAAQVHHIWCLVDPHNPISGTRRLRNQPDHSSCCVFIFIISVCAKIPFGMNKNQRVRHRFARCCSGRCQQTHQLQSEVLWGELNVCD